MPIAARAEADPPLDAVTVTALAGLERLAGFAPNEVLVSRLRRAARQAAAAVAREPHLDDPHWAALVDAVTVQETRMFRGADQIEAFRAGPLGGLIAGARGRPLRLVSAGCATGEEAWTLAILAARAGATQWRVLGLDLCRPALDAAAEATYRRGPPDALREVPSRDLAMLAMQDGAFRPVEALRPHVGFRRANLLDPLPSRARADAILCRNVLIYLTAPARIAVLLQLVAALRPGGALLLGPTDAPPPGLGLVPFGPEAAGIWRKEGGE
ncbi:CheR family methyltransferase [Falsiroseomonas sp. HW251]|uniref:CheR family methyltransferase n=1 Tax=Falsiroseomonas sp. HW251 TaxID=3390998 RepID=UPI003D31FE41